MRPRWRFPREGELCDFHRRRSEFAAMRGLQSSHSRNAWRRGGLVLQFVRGLATAVAREAKVLSFGDGSHGALGHTDCFGGDAYEPEEVPGLPDDVVSVGAGHYHSMAVSQSGQLWAWGRNTEGQLGARDDANSREKWHVPQRVRGLESAEVVFATGSGVVSMAIGRDGSLWTWGKSKRGQLGLGANVVHAPTPQRVEGLIGQHVVQVALGWGHTLALTAQGHVYSWGYAADGRLGFQPPCVEPDEPDENSSTISGEEAMQDVALRRVMEDMEKEKRPVLAWEPVRVDALVGVTQISCGMDHSLTLNEHGELWSFGDNSLGQLGRPVAIPTTNVFTDTNPVERVQGPLTRGTVVHLGAGLGHSLAVSAQGSVYSWGWNAGHQLGRNGSIALPGSVAGLEEDGVVKVVGGRAHSVGLTAEGGLWVWGSGKNGRLGLGSPADEPSPELLEAERVADVTCGFDHTLVLLS